MQLAKSDFTVHGGGFSSPIVPQEGCDLALVEIDVETVDRWTRASVEHLHQVLDLHPQHLAQWIGLKEQLTWVGNQSQKRVNTLTETLDAFWSYDISLNSFTLKCKINTEEVKMF